MESFHDLLQHKPSVIHAHIVGMELSLSRLPPDTAHVSGFGGEHTGVLEPDAVYRIDAVLMVEHISGVLAKRAHCAHSLENTTYCGRFNADQ
jgi:hypothetical protein